MIMMNFKTRVSRLYLTGGLIFSLALSCAQFSFADDHHAKLAKVTVAYLYNFIRYVDWPQSSFESAASNFIACYSGSDKHFLTAISKIEGKKKDGHALIIEKYGEGKLCHVLFIDDTSPDIESLISVTKGENILTISSVKDFAKLQGMIELIKSGKKLRFTINKTALKQSQLKVSSKLMRLANVVE